MRLDRIHLTTLIASTPMQRANFIARCHFLAFLQVNQTPYFQAQPSENKRIYRTAYLCCFILIVSTSSLGFDTNKSEHRQLIIVSSPPFPQESFALKLGGSCMDLADDEAPPPPRAAVRSRPSSWSSSGSSGGVEYTSLRDVLAEAGPGSGGGSFGDAGAPAIDFDASNINIRNQLLKHAASAYLQSAIVVPQRDPGCLSRLWRRMLHRRRCRILLRPWPGCCGAGDPPCLCAAYVAGSARRLVAFLSGCVARMWT